LVVEKISSCNELKAELIRLKPELKDLIGVYHSNSETSDDINELYEKSKSKPISIVTHARLNIDSAQSWMFTNSVIAPYCQSIIIDEMPNNQVFTVNIMIKTLLDKTRRLNPELAVLMEMILSGEQNPIEADKILPTLVSMEPSLREYVGKLVKYNTRLADAGIVTDSSTNNLLINLEKNYIKRKSDAGMTELLVKRLSYQFFMIYFAILSGRFKQIENDYLACSVLSPLYTWNALHGVGTIILDATGSLEMYPEDLCHIVEPKIKPRSNTIKVHRISGSPDKRFWTPGSKESAESLSNHFYLLVKDLLKSTCINGNVVYLCTWMDKAKPTGKEETLGEESGTTSLVVNSNEIDVSYRNPQHRSSLVRKFETDSNPRIGRWFKKGEINAESAVFEAASDLKIYTNFDKEMELKQAVEDGIKIGSDEYSQISEELEKKIQLYISHFGKTKGENRYSHCNTVIVLGDHFLPQRVYNDRTIYIKREISKVDIAKSVAASTVQEIERSKSRQPEVSEPINCYLLASQLVFDEIRAFFGWKTSGVFFQGELSEVRGADIYSELKKLTKSQKANLIKINTIHGGLFEKQPISLGTAEIGELLEIRPNNVIRSLEAICKKSRFKLELHESNQVGRTLGNKFTLQLV